MQEPAGDCRAGEALAETCHGSSQPTQRHPKPEDKATEQLSAHLLTGGGDSTALWCWSKSDVYGLF